MRFVKRSDDAINCFADDSMPPYDEVLKGIIQKVDDGYYCFVALTSVIFNCDDLRGVVEKLSALNIDCTE